MIHKLMMMQEQLQLIMIILSRISIIANRLAVMIQRSLGRYYCKSSKYPLKKMSMKKELMTKTNKIYISFCCNRLLVFRTSRI